MSQEPLASNPIPPPSPLAPSPLPPAAGPLTPAPSPVESSPPEPVGEMPLWTGRTHWTHFLGSVLLWIVVSVLIGLACSGLATRGTLTQPRAFQIGAGLIAAAGLFVFFRILLKVWSSRYRLTTQRLFIERGILSQVIDQIELVRVDDVRVRRSISDRILGLGTLEIVSTDITDKRVGLDGIRDPQAVSEHVRERMRQLRKKSLYVEHL